MKSCPTCNRTFEDTFTFCLVDGAILSAPYDPQATRRIPLSRGTDPPPTEIMSQGESPNNATLPASLLSPQPIQKAPISSEISNIYKGRPKGQKMLIGAMFGVPIGFIFGLIGVILKVKENSFDVITSAVVVGIIIGALTSLVRKD